MGEWATGIASCYHPPPLPTSLDCLSLVTIEAGHEHIGCLFTRPAGRLSLHLS
jgi:hypothetical protein